MIFALPVFVLVAIFPARSPLAAVVICAAAALVGLPVAYRVARPMRDFYWKTATKRLSQFDQAHPTGGWLQSRLPGTPLSHSRRFANR